VIDVIRIRQRLAAAEIGVVECGRCRFSCLLSAIHAVFARRQLRMDRSPRIAFRTADSSNRASPGLPSAGRRGC